MSEPDIDRLKAIIAEALQLEDVKPSDMADDEPLMDSEMGLDSIDALELIVQVEKHFGIKIKSVEDSKKALRSIKTLHNYIVERSSSSGGEAS